MTRLVFNVRPCETDLIVSDGAPDVTGRGFHVSTTSHLNLSRFWSLKPTTLSTQRIPQKVLTLS